MLLLAAAAPSLPLADLAALALVILLLQALAGAGALRACARTLARLRWLLVAILAAYVGFTPGEPFVAALPAISAEGLAEGARRALVLVVLAAAVDFVVRRTPLPQLATAVVTLLAPLAWLGIDTGRFGRRIALTLEAVAGMDAALRDARVAGAGSRWRALARVIEHAEAPP